MKPLKEGRESTGARLLKMFIKSKTEFLEFLHLPASPQVSYVVRDTERRIPVLLLNEVTSHLTHNNNNNN